MDEKLYKIEFDGELSEGTTEEEARIQLKKRFKLEENKIERMFSGEPLILKMSIPQQDAEKYKKAFLNIGLVCNIYPLTEVQNSLPENSEPPVEQEIQKESTSGPVISIPESKKEDQFLLNVREVIGFTGRGLKSPETEIEIYESAQSEQAAEVIDHKSSEVVDPGYIEITSDSEFLKIDENRDFPVEMIEEVSGGDHSSSKFRIVFSGKISVGQTTEKVKQALSELFGIEEQDADILFSNVPVLLKDNVEENRAIQYQEQFHNVGAKVELVKIEDRVEGIKWD